MAFMGKQPNSAPKCVIHGLTCVVTVFLLLQCFLTITRSKTVFDVFMDVRCFGCRGVVLALLCPKYIFLKTNKADQTHCENWQRESSSEFQKTSTMSHPGEKRKQLRDFTTQGFKQTPLGSGTI